LSLRHLTTARLRLDAVVPSDLDDLYALMSDARTWAHFPSGRHTSPEQTRAGIEHSLGHWERDGLGYWMARLDGQVVGTGGSAIRVGTAWWNLYYRFTPAVWGRGLAAELVTAALDAAHQVRPDLPVIAYMVEHNVQSRGRAERSGLSLVWRGPDVGNPDPDAVRLVYADRPVAPDLLDRITAHP
jgi:RimJ/RimL family protein N-acetyltransferase